MVLNKFFKVISFSLFDNLGYNDNLNYRLEYCMIKVESLKEYKRI